MCKKRAYLVSAYAPPLASALCVKLIENYCSMEFFKEVHSPDLDIVHLKNLVTVKNLTSLCASISSVTAHKESEGDIYCIWGAFNIKREETMGSGLTFYIV